MTSAPASATRHVSLPNESSRGGAGAGVPAAAFGKYFASASTKSILYARPNGIRMGVRRCPCTTSYQVLGLLPFLMVTCRSSSSSRASFALSANLSQALAPNQIEFVWISFPLTRTRTHRPNGRGSRDPAPDATCQRTG